jgi:hypothetical protein
MCKYGEKNKLDTTMETRKQINIQRQKLFVVKNEGN